MRVAAPIALLVLAIVAACIETAPARRRSSLPPSGWVDVVLADGDRPTLGCEGPFEVADGRGGIVLAGRGLAADTVVDARASGVLLGQARLPAAPLEVRPTGREPLVVGGLPYRGVVRIEGADRTVLVNRVPVESYLLGVVPAEMPDRFGLQALKAQAVAARTYALNAMARRGRLHADQRSQVYGGRKAETLVSTRAVRQTAGEILQGIDGPIPAWYHSTCGGITVPAGDVFPDAPAGLLDRPVTCPDCRSSPHYEWVREFDVKTVAAALRLSSATIDAVAADDGRFPARPRRLTVSSGPQHRVLSAADFRSELSAGRPYTEQLLSTLWAAAPEIRGDHLVVRGRGWGHGVGMCQYGARGLADRGADYGEILRKYYPGARLAAMP